MFGPPPPPPPPPTSLALWLRGALLGAALGTMFLGIGGRVAMRGIAAAQGAAGGFSLGGTLTVVMLGTLSGVVAALLYVASRLLLRRHAAWARIVFGIVLLGVALRGLKPLDHLRLGLFLPLFLAFAVALDRLWERQANRTTLQSVGVSAT